jgi:hypothetical protein
MMSWFRRLFGPKIPPPPPKPQRSAMHEPTSAEVRQFIGLLADDLKALADQASPSDVQVADDSGSE